MELYVTGRHPGWLVGLIEFDYDSFGIIAGWFSISNKYVYNPLICDQSL